jgi:hypothetical protein
MAKIVKNTTLADIEVFETGVTLAASSSYTIPPEDYLDWATEETATEITADVNAGNIVINDGTNDLDPAPGLAYLKFPDDAANIRLGSQSVEEAVQEAADGKDFNIVDAGEFRTSRLFGAYNSANSQVITTSPTTIQINTEYDGSDSGSYLLSSGEIEFLDNEVELKIDFSITFDNINATRTNTQSFLEHFNGSTWNKITGSDVFTYERTSNADRQTGSRSIIVTLQKFDKIRLRSQTIQGSNNTNVAEGCSIIIEPSKKEAGVGKNLGLDCKTVIEKDDILSIWNCGEL